MKHKGNGACCAKSQGCNTAPLYPATAEPLSLSVLIFHTLCKIHPSMEALENWYGWQGARVLHTELGNERPLELGVAGNGKSHAIKT